jgi:D-xylose transport system substrate-binding protein
LNGGEEDNNAFLFKDGYDAVVQKHVDDGSWKLVADQFVPGWGANGEGQGIMEQILTDANNKVDAVFAANDNLAQQAINALDAAGVGSIPLSGQDASAAGIQNILLGKQTMTVYKPIQAEAETAVQAALALCGGQDPSAVKPDFAGSLSEGTVGLLDLQTVGIKAADGKPADSPTGEGVVPYLALTPIGVTVDNIADTVIADKFRTVDEICKGDTADTDFCKENS